MDIQTKAAYKILNAPIRKQKTLFKVTIITNRRY